MQSNELQYIHYWHFLSNQAKKVAKVICFYKAIKHYMQNTPAKNGLETLGQKHGRKEKNV